MACILSQRPRKRKSPGTDADVPARKQPKLQPRGTLPLFNMLVTIATGELAEKEAAASRSTARTQAQLRRQRAALEMHTLEMMARFYGWETEKTKVIEAEEALDNAKKQKVCQVRVVPRTLRRRAVAGGVLSDDWAA
eukprot:jgi/Ulvmu1/1314/UM011_0042.1